MVACEFAGRDVQMSNDASVAFESPERIVTEGERMCVYIERICSVRHYLCRVCVCAAIESPERIVTESERMCIYIENVYVYREKICPVCGEPGHVCLCAAF